MRLKYYEAEEQAFPKAEKMKLTVGQAVTLVQGVLALIGEPHPRFIIGAKPAAWHLCDKTNRTIYFNPPHVTVLEALHEAAHLLYCTHDNDHAFMVALLHAVLKAQADG